MFDAQTLIAKLNKVDRNEYDDVALATLDQWIKQIEEIEALRAVSENFIIKDKLESYRNRVESINCDLLEKYELPELERKVLLKEKNLYLDFINSFDPEMRLKTIAKEIENNL